VKNFDSSTVLIAYIASNIVGILFIWVAVKKPRLARLLFFLLFAWACWTNYRTAHRTPEVYIDYAKTSIKIYADFIHGWFKDHILWMVSLIAVGQALIACGMLLKGLLVKAACIGAIVFLLSIAPLGLYAGFPFSLTASTAAYLMMRRDDLNFIWKRKKTTC
jgi:hypothetical protein